MTEDRSQAACLSFAVFARTTLAGCLEWFFGDVWPVKGCFVVADS
jgi:hypothetical protein